MDNLMSAQPVLVCGSINTDLVVSVTRAPDAGETVTGSGFATFGGGKGANQAVAAARYGAAVAMLGALGDDDFGRARLDDLQREGIDTSSVGIDQRRPSGVASITVEASGENRIAYVPGATLGVTESQAITAFERVRPGVVLTTLELPLASLKHLYAAAKQAGATVICNATPEPENGSELAGQADILIVNEPEALALLGIEDGGDWELIATQLLEQGPAVVVITLGAAGALLATPDTSVLIPALNVEVVDTTGAGDAFCGAFAAAIAAGSSIEKAARIGVVAGSLAVTKPGAQPSMPSRDDIERMLSD